MNLTSTDNGSLQPDRKAGRSRRSSTTTARRRCRPCRLPKSVSVEEGNARHRQHPLQREPLERRARSAPRSKLEDRRTSAPTRRTTRAANGKVVFQKGQKTKTISVDVKGDRRDEPDEAFTVELQQPGWRDPRPEGRVRGHRGRRRAEDEDREAAGPRQGPRREGQLPQERERMHAGSSWGRPAS